MAHSYCGMREFREVVLFLSVMHHKIKKKYISPARDRRIELDRCMRGGIDTGRGEE